MKDRYRRRWSSSGPLGMAACVAACFAVSACERTGDEAKDDEQVSQAAIPEFEPDTATDVPEESEYLAAEEGDAARDAAIVTGEPEERLLPVDELLVAQATIEPASGRRVTGTLEFREEGDSVAIEGELHGLEPGIHGLHIHAAGDCTSPDATSAGGHFAPDDDQHGSPASLPPFHHVGDLGNISADEDGIAVIEKSDSEMTLGTGENTIVSRAVIVHAEPDDLHSQPSGDAADRIGCGVVTRVLDAAY